MKQSLYNINNQLDAEKSIQPLLHLRQNLIKHVNSDNFNAITKQVMQINKSLKHDYDYEVNQKINIDYGQHTYELIDHCQRLLDDSNSIITQQQIIQSATKGQVNEILEQEQMLKFQHNQLAYTMKKDFQLFDELNK